ncbi:FHA domain-containing protein [Herbiconiux liangxiaofengii]|uniref:FHA domain-containing protein n=1 Tax=Herbiconiux liangxiaofengii TaxID=3342795 RepID=UPI0035B7D31B
MKCRTCGTTLSSGALLCGECGTSAIAPRPTLGDTARYDRTALRKAISAESARAAGARGAGDSRPAPSRHVEPRRDRPVSVPSRPDHSLPTPSRPDHSLPTPSRHGQPHSRPEPERTVAPTPPAATSAPARAANPTLQAPAPTPPAPAPAARPTFSLVFSTGESIRVAGPGLVGRNPTPAPGEHVDYLVQLIDPQRSVSKTHLAFGVEGGELWVADHHSSNGTRLDPGEPGAVELAPGVRTTVPRGTRVGMGDEWFDVH